MPLLSGRDRARLPDKAFAYVDSSGERRLPIHDESHVRNALSRFNQVSFEDAAARERARGRLLQAAKALGIVPLGFITAQLQAEQSAARYFVLTGRAPITWMALLRAPSSAG